MHYNRVSRDECHIHMCHTAVSWTSDVTYVCEIGLRGLKGYLSHEQLCNSKKNIWRILPNLRRMPTLCRSATLPAKTTISKWRVTATIRQLLQLPIGGTSAFGVFKSNSIPPPTPLKATSGMHWYSGVTSCQLYGNECLEWQIPTQL